MSFSLFFGTFKGFGVALPYIVSPFGYYATDIAILASMPIIGGFCSSLVVPSIYKKWQRYKPILLVMQIFTMAMFVLLYYTCWINIKLLVLLDTFVLHPNLSS
jgi:FLVCR family feline leukemia virus subgroup C receptor-related protein